MVTFYVREASSNFEGITVMFTDTTSRLIPHGRPLGGWQFLLFNEHVVEFGKFLESFVIPSLDMLRLTARTFVETMEPSPEMFEKVAILDPTFTPPGINKRCKWQMDMIRTIAVPFSVTVITTCMTPERLRKYIQSIQD